MSNPILDFERERADRIESYSANPVLLESAKAFNTASNSSQYSYNFSWMGRPIIQYPQDMIAMQEIVWNIKPDLIIETGIAHGGSLIYYASLLELIGKGKVLGIDIDIRKHNRTAIEQHPMYKRIEMLEGSSIEHTLFEKVKAVAANHTSIIVVLDSNHTYEHVMEELRLYSTLVSPGSYIVVFDTIVEHLPEGYFSQARPWGIGNNPMTAVHEFLKTNTDFEIDKSINNKLLISVAPDGYLKRKV